MAKKVRGNEDFATTHDGSKNLGGNGKSVSVRLGYAGTPPASNTRANVAVYNGGSPKPTVSQTHAPAAMGAQAANAKIPAGKAAGGTSNLKADERCIYADGMDAGFTGKTSSIPSAAKRSDGVSVPKKISK